MPTTIVYNNQNNLYTAGSKQTFVANDNTVPTGTAGVSIASAATSPVNLVSGDLWLLSTDNHLQFQSATAGTQQLAFMSDVTSGTATTISGSIAESQVTNLVSDLASANASILAETNRATTAEGNAITTAENFATAADATNLTTAENFATAADVTNLASAEAFATTAANGAIASAETFATSAANSAAGTAQSNAETFSANAANITTGVVSQGVLPTSIVYNNQNNTFADGTKQIFGTSNAGSASLNIQNGTVPVTAPVAGDIWLTNTNIHPNFVDQTSATQQLAFLSDITTGTATTITGSIAESQVTNLVSDLASANASILAEANRATTAEGNAITTAENFATAADATNLTTAENFATAADVTNLASADAFGTTGAIGAFASAETFATSAANSAAGTAQSNAETFSANAANITTGVVSQGVLPTSIVYNNQNNLYTAGSKQTFVANDNTVPTGTAGVSIASAATSPVNLVSGDLWLLSTDNHLQFQSATAGTQQLAFVSDVTNSALTAGTGIAISTGVVSNTGVLTATGDGTTITATVGQNPVFSVGAISEGQVTNLTGDLAAANAAITAETGRATLAETNAITTAENFATNADLTNLATAESFATGAANSAASAAQSAAEAFSANAANITTGTILQTVLPTNIVYNNQANTFAAGFTQTLGASSSTAATLNIPNTGAIVTAPNMGDIWSTSNDAHLQFRDMNSATQQIAFLSDVTNSALTAGTGISISGGAINNGGVLSFNGNTGAVTGLNSVTAGNAGITIGGTATDPTVSNAGVLSFNGATGAVTGVSSVGVALPSIFANNTMQTITTAGNFNANLANENANFIFAGPSSGGASVPSFRALVEADLPSISDTYVDLTSNQTAAGNKSFTGSTTLAGTTVNGTLSLPSLTNAASQASQALQLAGTDASTNPTLFQWNVTPAGTLDLSTQFTGLNSGNLTDTTLSIANTGIITFAPGQTFPGASSGSVTSVGSGFGLTGGPITSTGSLAIDTTAIPTLAAANNTFTGSITAGSFLGNATSATTAATATSATTAVNVSGIVAVGNGGTGVNATSTTANQVFASPNGSAGAPSFRGLVSADLPTAQATRTICYVAGADNTSSPALVAGADGGATDSVNGYFHNMIGALTLAGTNSVWCQTNTGSATINLTDGATPFLGTALTCTTAGANGTSSIAIAIGDSINFSLASIASGAPTRITVCFAAKVN